MSRESGRTCWWSWFVLGSNCCQPATTGSQGGAVPAVAQLVSSSYHAAASSLSISPPSPPRMVRSPTNQQPPLPCNH
ncbi:hypothetical protein C5167_038297 [Papaver somniferum]|uniref:Uncharacterized protein n=1 Tax=Papaver somniferum TaxID=3469 RepID=A0A4Y7IBE2_PAPSO|nr:hypothetical protein C5167_038297 [Papaver somniferum]